MPNRDVVNHQIYQISDLLNSAKSLMSVGDISAAEKWSSFEKKLYYVMTTFGTPYVAFSVDTKKSLLSP